jgi:DNA-binding LacI/PurR family transcriptional regulator
MTVTIKDIAKAAGVYPSAVSNALNNKKHTRISEERRQYIRKIAEEMGYRPNLQAACLRKKKKPAIGVFLPDWRDPLLYELVVGLSEGSVMYDIPLSLHFGLTMENYVHFIDSMTSSRHSGIISYVPYLTEDYPKLIEKLKFYQKDGGRIITINPYNAALENNLVANIDEVLGGELAAEYILKQNCKNYAAFCFDNDINHTRAFSFGRELEEKGKSAEVIRIPSIVDFDKSELINHIDRLIDVRDEAIGIFAASAVFCNYIISRCLEKGVKIGKEVILVGYDYDESRYGDYVSIPRIVQPFRELGRQVVQKMDNVLAGRKEKSVQLKPELMIP